MLSVWILTMKDGEVVLHKHARDGVTLDEVCEIAENEVMDGYADYARVTVNGNIYMELEA